MTMNSVAPLGLLFGVLAITLASPAGAQAEAPLTLKDAAQKAVLTNPEVLARWHTISAAAGERDAGAGALLPRLDLSANSGSEQRTTPAVVGSRFDRNQTSLTLTQLLYDGFATSNDVKRLDRVYLARIYEFFDVSETVALEAVRAYYDVLRYRELVRLAEENFIQHRSVFDQTERRVKARVARAVDLEQISARLALAESNLLTETSNLHDTTARFQRIVGQLPTQQMPMPAQLTRDIPPDATTAILGAQQRNGALRAAIENVRASDAALASRNGAFQPRFDVRLRRDQGKNLDGISGRSDGTTAEVVMSWNLFNGLSDRARKRQFAEQLNVAKDLRDKTCRDIRQTLQIAYNDVRKLREQIGYLDQNKVSVEKARNAYRQQFDIGQRTLLDLLDTENELFQARRALANAEQDLNISYARTHASLGTLLAALEISKIETGSVSGLDRQIGSEDAAQHCPAEPVVVYTVDKDALILRAVELQKQTALMNARERAVQEAAAGTPGTFAVAPTTPTPEVPSAPTPTSSAASAPASAPTRAPTPTPATPSASMATGELTQALERWRAAWSRQDADAYLGSYAPTFVPATGGDREAWKQKRRDVLGRSTGISIDVTDVNVTLSDANRATMVFKQTYRSSSYRDVVTKTLQWVKLDNRWLISRESSAAPLSSGQ